MELLLSVSDLAGGNSDTMELENCARGDWLDSEQLPSVSVSDMVGGKINGMEKLLVGPLGSGKRCENEEVMVMEGFLIIIS